MTRTTPAPRDLRGPRGLRLVVATAVLQSAAGATALGALRGLASAATRADAGTDPVLRVPATLETLAWVGLLGCTLWFGAAVLVAARDLARHPSRPAPRAVGSCLRPALVRSLLVALVGGSLVTPGLRVVVGDAAPGAAAPGWDRLDGLPLPGLPLDPPRPARVLVVHPGDSLWTLTASLLPAGAPDARVARTWPRLRQANLRVLGPDPDLVHPGTRLRVPSDLEPNHPHPAGAHR